MPTPATINAVCYHPCRSGHRCATLARRFARQYARQNGCTERYEAMPTIRRATLDDLEALTRLRLALFRDMDELRDEHETADLAEAVRHFLATDLPTGRFIAWVVLDDAGTAIGCGGLVFVQKPPSMGNYSGREAYVMNMYTLPEWRGRGIAT